MENSQKIYEAYKPFRNQIRKTFLLDSLYVIWAYSQNLIYNIPIPSDIEVHPIYNLNPEIQKGIYPWTLEFLAKEIIANAEPYFSPNAKYKTFKKINFFSKIVNTINALDNLVASEYLNPNNILGEFSRIAYRQFPWQKGNFLTHLMRYYKIFSFDDIPNMIEEKIGLTIIEILSIGEMLIGAFLKKPAVLTEREQSQLDKKVKKFLFYFSKNLDKMRNLITSEQRFDDSFLYSGIALRFYPLIEIENKNKVTFSCPIPTLLFWRFTSGLYYDVSQNTSFSNAFGNSFENYIGDLFAKVFNDKSFKYIRQSRYKEGKNAKLTVDWILTDSNSALFIECKTKRMQLASKTQITSINIEKDIKTLADAIVQCYKSIIDYEQNLYINLPYDENRKIYPLIVTLESWYLFNPLYRDRLNEIIIKELRIKSIKEDILNTMPYSYCSAEEFEVLIQIIKQVGIKKLFHHKLTDQEKKDFQFESYFTNEYIKEQSNIVSNLFQEEYDILFKQFHKTLITNNHYE